MIPGVPFFALSDADRASEMRADPEAILKAASAPNAVLLPVTNGKVWVVRLPHPTPDGALWIPAEVPLLALTERRRRRRRRRGIEEGSDGGGATQGRERTDGQNDGEGTRGGGGGEARDVRASLSAAAAGEVTEATEEKTSEVVAGNDDDVDDDDDPLAHHKLSFLGFRGSDGAPVFTADVTGRADTLGRGGKARKHYCFPTSTSLFKASIKPLETTRRVFFVFIFLFNTGEPPQRVAPRNQYTHTRAYARAGALAVGAEEDVTDAVVKNPVTSRLYPPVADLASHVAVKDAKAVGPEMSRNDAGLLAGKIFTSSHLHILAV